MLYVLADNSAGSTPPMIETPRRRPRSVLARMVLSKYPDLYDQVMSGLADDPPATTATDPTATTPAPPPLAIQVDPAPITTPTPERIPYARLRRPQWNGQAQPELTIRKQPRQQQQGFRAQFAQSATQPAQAAPGAALPWKELAIGAGAALLVAVMMSGKK